MMGPSGLSPQFGGSPQTWPDMGGGQQGGGGGGAGARPSHAQHAPAHPGFMQSMAGGGAGGGDYSRDAAYRNFVSRQAGAVEESRNARHARRHNAGSSSNVANAVTSNVAAAACGVGACAVPGGRALAPNACIEGAMGAGNAEAEREAAHALARQMAPTHSHQTSEDAELAGLIFSVVGGAIRNRFNSRQASSSTTPEKSKKEKKSKSKKSKKEKGGAADAPAAGSSSSGGGEVDALIDEILAALVGHDARCNIQVFSQQVSVLNQRLNKSSDPAQVEQLFWACQQNGVVDFADFLRRDSTRAYFMMNPEFI